MLYESYCSISVLRQFIRPGERTYNIKRWNSLVCAVMCVLASMPAMGDQGAAQNSSWADRLMYAGLAVEEPGFHVWGSSPVAGPDGSIHLFVARWPVSAKFVPGWYTRCEIARYIGSEPEGPFKFKEVVLRGTGQPTWDRMASHNPTIQKIGNQYALLYIANTGKDFPASQRIGMVISESLEGPWRKVGQDGLILSPPDDSAIWSCNSVVGVNNPALLQHPDGRFFLYYKAMRKGDVRRMGVAIAETLEGPYVHYSKPLTSNHGTIEDGYAFIENGIIFLLTTDNDKGMGLLWPSRDGIHFSKPVLGFGRMEHYVSKESVESATNYRGKKFERPQILVQDGRPTHLYVASGANLNRGDGSCSYVLRIKIFSMDNPMGKKGQNQQILEDQINHWLSQNEGVEIIRVE